MMNRFHRMNPPKDGKPPEQTRFTNIQIEPWSDGRRVKIILDITPFLQMPNLEMTIADSLGQEVSRVSVVENIDFQLVFTMHIRSEKVGGEYTLNANINYPELGTVDERTMTFTTQESRASEEQDE